MRTSVKATGEKQKADQHFRETFILGKKHPLRCDIEKLAKQNYIYTKEDAIKKIANFSKKVKGQMRETVLDKAS